MQKKLSPGLRLYKQLIMISAIYTLKMYFFLALGKKLQHFYNLLGSIFDIQNFQALNKTNRYNILELKKSMHN